MTQPDRFEKMVKKATGPTWCPDTNIHKDEVLGLLRSQHRAMVRMVKTEQRRHVSGSISVTNADVDRHGLRGYHKACRDILAALARYRKGTR